MEYILNKPTLNDLYLKLKNKSNSSNIKKYNFNLDKEYDETNVNTYVKLHNAVGNISFNFFIPTFGIEYIKNKYGLNLMDSIERILNYWRIDHITQMMIPLNDILLRV